MGLSDELMYVPPVFTEISFPCDGRSLTFANVVSLLVAEISSWLEDRHGLDNDAFVKFRTEFARRLFDACRKMYIPIGISDWNRLVSCCGEACDALNECMDYRKEIGPA